MKELLDYHTNTETPRSNVKYYLDNLQDLKLIETERYKKELKIKLTLVGALLLILEFRQNDLFHFS